MKIEAKIEPNELVERIRKILNDTEINNLNIIKTTTFVARKDFYEKFDFKEDIKISILKKESIEFSRKPYCNITGRIGELFTLPEVVKFNGLDFSTQQ